MRAKVRARQSECKFLRPFLLLLLGLFFLPHCRTSSKAPDLGKIPIREGEDPTGKNPRTSPGKDDGNRGGSGGAGSDDNDDGKSGSGNGGGNRGGSNEGGSNGGGSNGGGTGSNSSDTRLDPTLDNYLPSCSVSGLKSRDFEMKFESVNASTGRMVLVTGQGFSCKASSDTSNDKLYPICARTCPSQASTIKNGWGFCQGSKSFDCKK